MCRNYLAHGQIQNIFKVDEFSSKLGKKGQAGVELCQARVKQDYGGVKLKIGCDTKFEWSEFYFNSVLYCHTQAKLKLKA